MVSSSLHNVYVSFSFITTRLQVSSTARISSYSSLGDIVQKKRLTLLLFVMPFFFRACGELLRTKNISKGGPFACSPPTLFYCKSTSLRITVFSGVQQSADHDGALSCGYSWTQQILLWCPPSPLKLLCVEAMRLAYIDVFLLCVEPGANAVHKEDG